MSNTMDKSIISNKQPKSKLYSTFVADRSKSYQNSLISKEELIYVTCFDPDDSTIFFYEYFTNKIIEDPNPPSAKKEEKAKEQTEKIQENNTNNPYKNNNNTNNLNQDLTRQAMINNTISNTNNIFMGEKLSQNRREELISYFSKLWIKIKDLSELEKNSFFSDAVKNKFLKRPLLSRFTFSEKLGISPIASTFPLPQVLSRYDKVSLNIYFDFSISKYNEEQNPIVLEKNVGLFYVVDTLIKDALNFLRKKLKEHKKNNEFEDNNYTTDYLKDFDDMINNPKNKFLLKIGLVEEFIFGDSPISSNSFIRRKIREREKVDLLLLRKSESELKPNLSQFPLLIRIESHQPYCFDSLFNYFSKKINQKNEIEVEKSIIFMYKNGLKDRNNDIINNINNKNEVKNLNLSDQKEENNNNDKTSNKMINESITNNNNNITNNFTNNMSNNMSKNLIPNMNFNQNLNICGNYQKENLNHNQQNLNKNSYKDFYMKNDMKRRDYLKKYCESGEADYPFNIKIKSITNLTAILYHIKDDQYDFGQMIIMNFKKKLKNKKNFIEFLQEKFNFCKKKPADKEDKEKIESEKEKKHEAKLMSNREKNYILEKQLIDELNFMNFNKNLEDIQFNTSHSLIGFSDQNFYSKLKDYYNNMLIKKNLKEHYNCFENFNVNEKKNFYYHVIDDHYNPFNLILDYIEFLPVHIMLEVSLVYGMSCVRIMKTKFSLIKEDIVINEKINFSQFKHKHKNKGKNDEKNKDSMDYEFLYYSNIPRESRLCFEILCYDKEMKKKFVLGSSSLQIYNEHGIMKTGLQEVYIWPFWENDLKIPFSTPFHFKKSNFITDKENFDKRNYGIINVEFPKFPTNLINTYKTPHSYSEFLRIKKSNSDNKKKYDHPEFKKFYGDTISSTEKIFKNLYYSYLNDFNGKYTNNNNNDSNNNNNNNNNHEKTEDEDSTFLNGKNFFEKLLEILLKEPLKKINDKERQTLINARDYISTIPSKLEIFLRCINWFDPIQAYIAKIYLKKWARIEPIDAVGLLDSRFINTYVREYALSILNEGTDDIKDLYLLQIIYAQMNDCYLEGNLTDFIIENSLRSHYFASKFIFMSKLLKDHPLFFERISIITAQIFMLSGTKLITEISKTSDCSNLFSCTSIRAKNKRKNGTPKDLLTKEIKTELSDLFYTKKFLQEKEKSDKEKENLNNEENLENEENKENSKFVLKNNDEKEKENENENEKIREIYYNKLSAKTLLDVKIPVFPGFFFSDVIFDSLKAYDSKMVPMEYALYPSEGNYFEFIEKKFEEIRFDKSKEKKKICKDMRIFYKNGDDLRQDHLALLALRTMDILWLENDLDLKVFGYSVLPTGVKDGFLEKCNATPYNDVQTGKTLTGIFDRELIKKYFDKKAKDIVEKEIVGKPRSVEEIKSQQTDNFVRSLAGYCVGTCVLGIADRHSDNIMIQDNGIFLHIDYGHILGNFKEKFGIKREKCKFVLDQTMVNFCKQVNMEEDFKNFCVKAYNILRKNSSRLLNLLMVLSSSGMPELYCIPNILYFIENLKLDKKNDEDAGNYFLCLINQSKNDKYRYFDNIFHNLNHIKVGANGGKKSDKNNKGFFSKYLGCLKKQNKKNTKNPSVSYTVNENGKSFEVKKN